jgi:hypothetical protein
MIEDIIQVFEVGIEGDQEKLTKKGLKDILQYFEGSY